MSEKTLGQILDEAFAQDAGVQSEWHLMPFKIKQRCEIAAQAVIEAHEARKWKPILNAYEDFIGLNPPFLVKIEAGELDENEVVAFVEALRFPTGEEISWGERKENLSLYLAEHGSVSSKHATHFQHLPQPPKELK